MTAPAAPPRPPYPWLSRFLLGLAAVLFLFAAVTVCDSDILSAPAAAWFYGAFGALALGLAVS